MARGEMQKMLRNASRFCAKMIPAVMAAGSAGGTQIVMTSNEAKITCTPVSPSMI